MTHPRRRLALALIAASLLLVSLTACAPKEEAAKPAPAAKPADAAAARPAEPGAGPTPLLGTEPDEHSDHPRISFTEPANGATVTSPVHIVFRADNFTIEPKGDGAVHPGAGHHHIGVDTQCLPPGTVIPTAAPWIHFGDGSSQIDVQLPPGEHHIVAQVGDGEHRTLADPGLCAELHLNVVEGAAPAKEGATQ